MATATQTFTESAPLAHGRQRRQPKQAQIKVSVDLTRYAKLSREQAGHLRHFHNLVAQPDGQWNHMGGEDAQQEWFDAYRYQIATMLYAASLAHYHRLPALRSAFKTLFRRIIHKMLCREVWSYWYLTSQSGTLIDPDLKEMRKPWADPVIKENIMYSGHLLMMVSLYAMLFDDDEYEKEGAIEFSFEPLFWGFGKQVFSYNTQSLQKVVMDTMASTGNMGACCEPNVVFIICNQFPIIGIRLNDVRHGTKQVDQLLVDYVAAWDKKGGFLNEDGSYKTYWMHKQDQMVQIPEPSAPWACAFMNTWNSDFVKASYDRAALGIVTNTDTEGIQIQPIPVIHEFRKLVDEEGLSPTAGTTLKRAKEIVREKAKDAAAPTMLIRIFGSQLFGYVVQWLSELGKQEELDAIYKYADERLQPVWENGGLFYRREDAAMNEDLEWTFMSPCTGNTAIAYARLNIPDGMKKIYEEPWTKETLASKPYVDGVGLGDGVDFLRAIWDETASCLVLTMRTWDGQKRHLKPVVRNVGAGLWDVYVDGELARQQTCKAGQVIELELEVGGDECDVVLIQNSDLRK